MNPRGRFLLMGIFLLVNQVYAFYGLEDHSDDLIVILKNTGSENCYLIEKNIASGELLAHQNIPSTLYATGENQGFTVSGKTIEITLSYHCGNQKVFSLYMKNFWQAGLWPRSLNKKFVGTDVFETHKETLGWRVIDDCKPPEEGGCKFFGEATKVSWVITH